MLNTNENKTHSVRILLDLLAQQLVDQPNRRQTSNRFVWERTNQQTPISNRTRSCSSSARKTCNFGSKITSRQQATKHFFDIRHDDAAVKLNASSGTTSDNGKTKPKQLRVFPRTNVLCRTANIRHIQINEWTKKWMQMCVTHEAVMTTKKYGHEISQRGVPTQSLEKQPRIYAQPHLRLTATKVHRKSVSVTETCTTINIAKLTRWMTRDIRQSDASENSVMNKQKKQSRLENEPLHRHIITN